MILRDDKYFGIDRDSMFLKFKNSIIRNEESECDFKPDNNGQLDFLVYVSLLSKINNYGEFDIPFVRLIESMGFKPKSGSGSINDKVKQSIGRLENEYTLINCISKDRYLVGEVVIPVVEDNFFKLKMDNVRKILNNSLIKLNKDDYSNKYENKSKALYVYAYLVSMMGDHLTTEVTVNWRGCFPSLEKISSDCNVSKDYLLKLLAYFEYDGLLYTTNIGFIKDKNGNSFKAVNYYTDNIEYLSSSYIYSRAYYDKNEYSYSKYISQTKNLLSETTELFNESYKKLNEKELKCFKEHFGVLFMNTIYESEKYYIDINKENFDKYIFNKMYIRSKFKNVDCKEALLFIADNEMASIPLLTHIKNKIKALMYLYEIK